MCKLVCSFVVCMQQNSGFLESGPKWAATCDFQQCGILIWIDSDEPAQPPVKLRKSKCCSVSSLTVIEYSRDYQRLWSNCAYAQAGLNLCWLHIPLCLIYHVPAQMFFVQGFTIYLLKGSIYTQKKKFSQYLCFLIKSTILHISLSIFLHELYYCNFTCTCLLRDK